MKRSWKSISTAELRKLDRNASPRERGDALKRASAIYRGAPVRTNPSGGGGIVKLGLLAGAEFLIMPSQFESLSMVALEAWAAGKPVLANGRTEVLRGQCRRSNAGLWYEDYDGFRAAFQALERDEALRAKLGANGGKFFAENYSWNVIEGKYLRLLQEAAGRPGGR